MKRVLKKDSPITENLTEEITKGKGFTIYLNAESQRYLNELCKLFNESRSKAIQRLILDAKRGSLIASTLLGDSPKDKEVKEAIRKMASA